MKQCKHLETNPIVVDGVVYGYTTTQTVFAVNAATGQQTWWEKSSRQ